MARRCVNSPDREPTGASLMTTSIVISPTDSDNIKRCTKCGRQLPATREYFPVQTTGLYGLRSQCKACCVAYSKQRRTRHDVREREAAYDKRRMTDPVVRKMRKASASRHYQEHRDKRRERYANDPEFKARDVERCREYRASDQGKAVTASYRSQNIDKRRSYAREYAAGRRQTEDGRISLRANAAIRRARKLRAGGSFTSSDIEAIRTAQGNHCYLCGKTLKKYHIDHFIPLSKGGTNDPGNLRLACPKCNQSKSDKHPFELGVLL
jgi:5-methylcytosine-specific restriction endonuclease McrA